MFLVGANWWTEPWGAKGQHCSSAEFWMFGRAKQNRKETMGTIPEMSQMQTPCLVIGWWFFFLVIFLRTLFVLPYFWPANERISASGPSDCVFLFFPVCWTMCDQTANKSKALLQKYLQKVWRLFLLLFRLCERNFSCQRAVIKWATLSKSKNLD